MQTNDRSIAKLMTAVRNRKIQLLDFQRYFMRSGKVNNEELDSYLESHWIDVDCARRDDFFNFIFHRASRLLDAIEKATGKKISGKTAKMLSMALEISLLKYLG